MSTMAINSLSVASQLKLVSDNLASFISSPLYKYQILLARAKIQTKCWSDALTN